MRPLIMIVEDDKAIRNSMEMILDMEDFDTVSAVNGKEALDLLKNSKSKPQLILLDLMMPVMDGIEFLKCRKDDPLISNIPVLVLSAGVKKEQASELGACGFIKKPFSIETLLGAIRPII